MIERRLSQIKVSNRLRKEIGDVSSLVNSIKEQGLLHPIVINRKNELVAGYRRLKAYQKLAKQSSKWRTIPVTVLNISDKFKAELHENTIRKNFSIKEVANIAKKIAKTRIPHRPKGGKLPSLPGKTRDIVSSITNYSPRQIDKINEIVSASKKNIKYKKIMQDVDAGKKSINTAHTLITVETRNLPKIPLPKGRYDVFYVDVPIKFMNVTIRMGAKKYYKLMSVQQLIRDFKKLPSAKNAVMFFWMSPSIIHDEVPVKHYYKNNRFLTIPIPTYKAILDSAGFKVKQEFSWNKRKIGGGFYNRNQHESLLFCIKGKMPTPAKLFSSVIVALRGKHSEKPNAKVQKMIEEMYPSSKKIKRKYCQLYGRNTRKNWTTHGNQLK